MKVCLIQMNSVSDKAANIAAAERLMTRAVVEERPDLVMLPEQFDWAGGAPIEKRAAAERIPDGPAAAMARAFAIRHNVIVHAGSLVEEAGDAAHVRNTTVVFGPDGAELARYAKIHLFDVTAPDGTPYRESAATAPGRALATYPAHGLTIGCAICYDLRFPEMFQALRRRGADVLALPSAFTLQTGKDHWEALLRARAIETQCYVLAPAQCGAFDTPSGRRQTYGHTLAIDPWGHVVARASDGEGYVAVRLDRDLVARVRRQMPVAEHRVPAAYVD